MKTLGTLTIAAYIFAGMQQNQEEYQQCYELYGGGELELCHEAVSYAPLMEELFQFGAEKIEIPGIYDYEVAEPFGVWFRQWVITLGGAIPDKSQCHDEIRRLATEFFSCDGRFDTPFVVEVISDFFKRR